MLFSATVPHGAFAVLFMLETSAVSMQFFFLILFFYGPRNDLARKSGVLSAVNLENSYCKCALWCPARSTVISS